MTESQQSPSRSGAPAPRGRDPLPPQSDPHDGSTLPLRVPVSGDLRGVTRPADAGPDPNILGFAAEPLEDDETEPSAAGTGPGLSRYADGETSGVAVAERPPPEAPERPLGSPYGVRRPVVLRRAERVGGTALLLAGAAAGLSLWLPWGQGVVTAGLVPVVEGVRTLGSGVSALARSDLWPPFVVVTGGAVLFVLGAFLFRRARTHRLVGVLALLVAEAVTIAVLVVLARAGWNPTRLGPGAWCAVAVAVLGLLGSLKATLTSPSITVEPR